MDKYQAIHEFWSSFGLTAYDENTVDDDAEMPYITYSVPTSDMDSPVTATASIWYRSTSWKDISEKVEEISNRILRMYPPTVKVTDGRIYITKGTPFSQRMSDPSDDMVRRVYLQVNIMFLTD